MIKLQNYINFKSYGCERCGYGLTQHTDQIWCPIKWSKVDNWKWLEANLTVVGEWFDWNKTRYFLVKEQGFYAKEVCGTKVWSENV